MSVRDFLKGQRFLLFFLLTLFIATTSHAQYILNGDFEIPSLAVGNFQYQPAAASWTFSGGSGVSSSNSGFTSSTPEVPAGKQVGFIQSNGSIQQSPYLQPGAILSFHATQRVNINSVLQSLSVSINGVPQPFIFGTNGTISTAACAAGTARSCTAITPPRDYYETYAVNLSSVTSNAYYAVAISGTNTVGDATALIDSVSISTPSSKSYGFWDQGLNVQTWRSDYASANPTLLYGPCLYTYGPDPIVNAGSTDGTTPYRTSSNPAPCVWSSSPPYAAQNWYSSSQYVAGNPHWILANNSGCVFSPLGPPNQTFPWIAPGAPGAAFSINALTSASDPAIGNHNVVSLIYNHNTTYGAPDCGPYLAFGSSSTHGNVQPIALMDAAGYHRPHLKFNESVFDSDGQSYGHARLVLSTSGWSDNIKRMIQIDLAETNFTRNLGLENYSKAWWNWNLKNSYYYPGAVIAYWDASLLTSACNINLTSNSYQLSFTNTYHASGGNANSIASYDIDLYRLIQCIADNSGWVNTAPNGPTPGPFQPSNGSTTLPNPIVVSQIEWALEVMDSNGSYYPQPHDALEIWNPLIQ